MRCRQRGEAQADDIDFLPKKKARQRKTYFLEVPVSVCLQGNAEGGVFFLLVFISLVLLVVQYSTVHINLFRRNRVVWWWKGREGRAGGYFICILGSFISNRFRTHTGAGGC